MSSIPKDTRPSFNRIRLEYAQEHEPSKEYNGTVVVFLAGPTPQYGGDDPATWSWRDTLSLRIEQNTVSEQKKIVFVCPEPRSRRWRDTPHGMADEQISWEMKWMKRADIIVFFHETRWKPNAYTLGNCYHGPTVANIGIQFRFEVGHFIGCREKERLFYLPKHAEGTAGVHWYLKHKPDSRLNWSENLQEFTELLVKKISEARL